MYISIALLLVLSAFFSGSETAFFSLSKIHIKKLERSNSKSAKRILSLLSKTRQLLITVLLGNTLVNILSTTIATLIAIDIAENFSPDYKGIIIAIEILIMTILLLVIGEIAPKIIAFSMPIKFASFSSFPLTIFKVVIYPFVYVLDKFLGVFTKKNDTVNSFNASITSQDFHNFIKSNSLNHPLESNEKKIIESIFRFSTTQVKEIIVPRVDVVGVELSQSLEYAKSIINKSGYSRIPVYNQNIDDIVGMLYAKDLLLKQDNKTLSSIMRKPFYVTENMKIQTLLNQFKKNKVQIAVVVDEYGGTSGLISLEDVIEELVGEIMDEYDVESPLMTQIGEKSYLISGMINIDIINTSFNLNIDEEYENLAAFIFDSLNHVPQKNEKFIIEGKAEFTITQIKRQRIHYVKLQLLEDNIEEN